MTIVRRINAREEFDALKKLAAKDGHGVYRPTHVVCNASGEIVGYLSVTPLPVVAATWLDTKRVSALESIRVLDALRTAARMEGRAAMLFRCDESSPFFPQMARLGLRDLGATHLFEMPV